MTASGMRHPGSVEWISSRHRPGSAGVISKSAVSPGPMDTRASRGVARLAGRSAPSFATGRQRAVTESLATQAAAPVLDDLDSLAGRRLTGTASNVGPIKHKREKRRDRE